MRRGLVVLGAVVVLASGCARSVVQPEAFDTTTTVHTSSSTTTSTTTAAPGAPGAPAAPGAGTTDVLDWDGVKYDYGQIVSASTTGAHGPMIEFDRWQVYLDGSGPIDAKSMTSEPIVAGNHDMPGVNTNPTIRRYRVAPDARLLLLANVEEICDDMSGTVPPEWTPFTMADLDSRAVPGIEQPQTALTFDSTGQVTRIRVSSSC